MTDIDVLVVGGGISGLSTAWWLRQEGLAAEVWEAGERPGGKIRSRRSGGYVTERAAALVMNFRPEVSAFVRAAGLEAVRATRSPAAEERRYLVHGHALRAVPMHLWSLFLSPFWSVGGRLRLLAEPLIRPGRDEDETVTAFVTRRFGREILEKAMEPFVAGTLAGDPDRASAAATLPRLVALERRYGSIAAGVLVNRVLRRRTGVPAEAFSFSGGMETLVDRLVRTPGMRLRTGHTVEAIEPCRLGWRVHGATPRGRCSVQAGHVVLAAPAPVAARLMEPLDGPLAELLDGITYAPITAVHMGLDRGQVAHRLDGTGFLVPRRAGLAINGNLWMSTIFPDSSPAGKVLLTTYLGGARRPEAATWDDARCVEETVRALRPLLGLTGAPEMVRIDRHRQGLPLYHGPHQARDRAMAERLAHLPGLHLEANYRGGVSVRDRIARGRLQARAIAMALRESPAGPVPAGGRRSCVGVLAPEH